MTHERARGMWYAVQRTTKGENGEPDFWKIVNHSHDENEMRNWVARLQDIAFTDDRPLIVVYDPQPLYTPTCEPDTLYQVWRNGLGGKWRGTASTWLRIARNVHQLGAWYGLADMIRSQVGTKDGDNPCEIILNNTDIDAMIPHLPVGVRFEHERK